MNMEKVSRLIALRRERAQLEAALSVNAKEADALSEELADDFAEDGVRHVASAGGTVYLAEEVRASLLPSDSIQDLRAAFDSAGAGWLVRESVNSNSLAAWVRELRKSGQDIPETVAPLIKVMARHVVRARLDGLETGG